MKLENATAVHRWALSTVATLAIIIVASVILVPPGGVRGAPLDGVVEPSCPQPILVGHVGDPGAPAPPTDGSLLGGVVRWEPSVEEVGGYLVCIRHGDSEDEEILSAIVGPDETSFSLPDDVTWGPSIQVVVFAFNEHGLSDALLAGAVINGRPPATPELPVDEATPVVAPPDTGTGAADASRGATTWVLALAAVVGALGGAGALALRRARA